MSCSSGSDRSSSSISSSPRKKPRKIERPDRYGMKKRSFVSRASSDDDDDDDFACRQHKHKFSRNDYRTKRRSSSSRQRARCSSSDFQDRYRKRSPLKNTHPQSREEAYFSKRRHSSESEDYRHHKRTAYKNTRNQSREGTYFSKKRKESSESDDYRHHKSKASKNLQYQLKRTDRQRRITSSPDSGRFQHHKRLTPVIQKRVFEKDAPDVAIVKEERLKNKYWRSKDNETSAMYRFYLKSGKYMEEKHLKKALKCITMALELCKNEDKFLSKIYCRRGNIYSLLEAPGCSFQGFLDWERAYIISKDNMEARKRMSKVLFMAANKCYRMKAREKALTLCNYALDLDADNGEAFILQKLLKKRLLKKMEDLSAKDSLVSNSGAKSIFKKVLNDKPASFSQNVCNEIGRFHVLIKEAVAVNNLPRALILIKKALKLHEASDDNNDEIFRKLYVLKQK